MKKTTDFRRFFFQKMQSGALILKVITKGKKDFDFQIISGNEYIYDLNKIDEVIQENMLSTLAVQSELFAEVEKGAKAFYIDGKENYRSITDNSTLLLKMNSFYIQKGIICIIIREKKISHAYALPTEELINILKSALDADENPVFIYNKDCGELIFVNSKAYSLIRKITGRSSLKILELFESLLEKQYFNEISALIENEESSKFEFDAFTKNDAKKIKIYIENVKSSSSNILIARILKV
jgi:hypothetical protein